MPPRVDLAVPAFGDKNHIGIDRRHRLIRCWRVTNAARYDGAMLPQLIDRNNTASDVWAGTAYRSKANARKSAVRSAVEHVFARQKGPMNLFIRTIGIARARTKIGLANLLYNMQRMVWLIGQATPA